MVNSLSSSLFPSFLRAAHLLFFATTTLQGFMLLFGGKRDEVVQIADRPRQVIAGDQTVSVSPSVFHPLANGRQADTSRSHLNRKKGDTASAGQRDPGSQRQKHTLKRYARLVRPRRIHPLAKLHFTLEQCVKIYISFKLKMKKLPLLRN